MRATLVLSQLALLQTVVPRGAGAFGMSELAAIFARARPVPAAGATWIRAHPGRKQREPQREQPDAQAPSHWHLRSHRTSPAPPGAALVPGLPARKHGTRR